MEPSALALFWAGVLGSAILVYVILDGFDLGVGILFGTTRNEAHRAGMMATIAPFWDGNETWLVVIGAGLFAAFPDAYAVLLSAFYFPVLLMLLGLIFRGIAFEFRYRSARMRRIWDGGFFLGSVVVAFTQGAAVGAMMGGLPVANGQYVGDPLSWLHPFAILTGIGLLLGYALLGAGWLVLKSEGDLRAWARDRVGWLAGAVFGALVLAFGVTFDYDALARSNVLARPWALAFPVIALVALAGIAIPARRDRDRGPFAMACLFFIAAFLSLVAMFWPYMVPYSVTVASAAAPDASLRFLFYGGVVVLPVIAAYTIGVYWVFRGKIGKLANGG
jgi:cytochrome d ubiquinol oxidase subunit II